MTYKYTEPMRKAIDKYNSKMKSLSIRITPDDYKRYKEASEKAGLTFRQFIIQAIEEKIEKDSKDILK